MTYTNCDLILSVKDAEDHEKWLKTRDLGIGGSDAAVHIVEDGETLWDIARDIADVRGQDIRETIYELQINNDIGDNDNLQPGQRIIIR